MTSTCYKDILAMFWNYEHNLLECTIVRSRVNSYVLVTSFYFLLLIFTHVMMSGLEVLQPNMIIWFLFFNCFSDGEQTSSGCSVKAIPWFMYFNSFFQTVNKSMVSVVSKQGH